MFKNLKELSDKIKAENELFLSLPNNEKKIIIAKDCLARIKFSQLKPICGMFAETNHLKIVFDDKKSLQSVLNEEVISCDVCAKGGLFLSYIGRVNQVTIDGLGPTSNNITDGNHSKLLEIFTPEEISYIEMAFEGHQYLRYNLENDRIEFTPKEIIKARKFYIKHGGNFNGDVNDTSAYTSFVTRTTFNAPLDNSKRLQAICRNIIRNNGEFKL